MRLIDADELKKSYENLNKTAIEFEIAPKGIIDLIDNAPTIPLPDFKEGYKQAIIDGKTNFSRPQGEWKYKIDGFHSGGFDYCSICNFPTPIYLEKPNYCPNCGAYMRGDAG